MTRDELRKEWLEALRSGKYKQGRNALRVGDAYCCLGVLCEIACAKEELNVQRADNGYRADGNAAWSGTLPPRLSEFVQVGAEINTLMDMNDFSHNSFSEIADYLENEVFKEEA